MTPIHTTISLIAMLCMMIFAYVGLSRTIILAIGSFVTVLPIAYEIGASGTLRAETVEMAFSAAGLVFLPAYVVAIGIAYLNRNESSPRSCPASEQSANDATQGNAK